MLGEKPQASSESLLTRPISVGVYFKTGQRLYYVGAVDWDEQEVLIEDCLSNTENWWTMDFFHKARKEVIHPSGEYDAVD